MTELEFCCDKLKGAWWFYAHSEPQINFCPYCGEKLSWELGVTISINLQKKRERLIEENRDKSIR